MIVLLRLSLQLGMGMLLSSAAAALTHSTHAAAHRHSAMQNGCFQTFNFSTLLFKARSAFGYPKAVVRTRTTVLCLPPDLTSAQTLL